MLVRTWDLFQLAFKLTVVQASSSLKTLHYKESSSTGYFVGAAIAKCMIVMLQFM